MANRKRDRFTIIYWSITIPFIIWASALLIWKGIYEESINSKTLKSESITSNITIDHVDRDGTIWVRIDKSEYYLYISDNGTQKKLEMK